MRMDHLASSKAARPAQEIPEDESEPEQSTPKTPSVPALVASTSLEVSPTPPPPLLPKSVDGFLGLKQVVRHEGA